MRCDTCGSSKMKQQKGLYHYSGAGLPNVYLKNVKWAKCEQCDDVHVEISRIAQLHRCIAYYIVLKDTFLTGQEIVFLRKMLRKSQRTMAKELGVSEVSLNRWERENRGHTKAMDTLFRLFYLGLQDDEYTHEDNQKISKTTIKFFGNIKKSDPEPISVEIDPKTCSVSEIYENAIGSSNLSVNTCALS